MVIISARIGASMGGGTYLHYYVSGAVTHPASLVPQIMPLPLGVEFSS